MATEAKVADTIDAGSGSGSCADEFHVGGFEATQAVAAHMDLRPGLRLLDVGSGIGGPARYFAAEHGCHVTGIDITEEFVQVAKSLTRLVKLDHLVEFRQASALQLPFASETFDRAYMIHVGMNLADKAVVFGEVRRVLKAVLMDSMRSMLLGSRCHHLEVEVPARTY